MASVRDNYEPQNGTPVVDSGRVDASDLHLKVRNFGPVALADIDVKPLTVFIGPNNSGKTYIAKLIYGLSKSMTSELNRGLSRSTRSAFRDYLGDLFRRSESTVAFADLSKPDRDSLNSELESVISGIEQNFQRNVREIFGVDDILRLRRAESAVFSFQAGSNALSALISVFAENHQAHIQLRRPSLDSTLVPAFGDAGLLTTELAIRMAAEQLWMQLADQNGFPATNEFYLPSARSGILTVWPLVTSMAISSLRQQLGPEPVFMPALSGIVGDFLQHYLSLFMVAESAPKSNAQSFEPALETLEGDILQGRVSMRDIQGVGRRLQYEGANVALQVESASSMVAELAPLDLWLRQLVQPGDLLIIDEPEAHLHPQNQRHMARVLVRLINAGVRVICPTHSSTILHQLSNHILAANAPDAERERLGFTEDDLLVRSKIGVYLFDTAGHDGTMVRQVEITEDFGISEDEFVAVAEQLGEESYRLMATESLAT